MSEFVRQKHTEAMDRARQRMKEEGVERTSTRGFQIVGEEVWEAIRNMTPEQQADYRQASELGTLPGDAGGGWDLLYTPDQGTAP